MSPLKQKKCLLLIPVQQGHCGKQRVMKTTVPGTSILYRRRYPGLARLQVRRWTGGTAIITVVYHELENLASSGPPAPSDHVAVGQPPRKCAIRCGIRPLTSNAVPTADMRGHHDAMTITMIYKYCTGTTPTPPETTNPT